MVNQTFSTREAAEACQRSETWVRNLSKRGFLKRGARRKIESEALIRGIIAHYEDLLENGSKKAQANRATDARTRLIELQIAERENRLFPVEESLALVTDIVMAAKAAFVGLPVQFTRDVFERRRLEGMIDDIFSRLSARAGSHEEAIRAGEEPKYGLSGVPQ